MGIVVEQYKPYIENLLRAEPWRAGPPQEGELCPGAFDWDGSAYWCCHACGRIGTSQAPLHHPVKTPNTIKKNMADYIAEFFSRLFRAA